jgi:antitoxin ParD1/3/4
MTLTISLSPLASKILQSQIDSGEYADAEAVIEAALVERQAQIEETDRWMLEQVLPTWEASKADPSRLLAKDEVFAKLREQMRDRAKVASV